MIRFLEEVVKVKLFRGKSFCVLSMLIFLGCASSTKPVAAAPDIPNGKALDTAIEEAAVRIDDAFKAGTEIALVSVSSPSAPFSEYVLSYLETVLVNSGKLAVVDRANLDKVRAELGFQLSGEVSDESAKSIGKMLGAGAIVTGSLVDLGDVHRLNIKSINVESAKIAASYAGDIANSARVKTLLASVAAPATVPAVSSVKPAAQAAAPDEKPPVSSQSAAPAQPPPVQTVQTPATPVAPPPEPVYKVGDKGPAGGWIFYDKGRVLNGWRYLEAAPKDELTAEWGAYGKRIDGTATGVGTGKRNTELILEYLKNNTGELGRAAQFCDEQFAGGFDDWFLPSKDELNLIYQNLKVKGLGGFGSGFYWSSSEVHNTWIWAQQFSNGEQYSVIDKNSTRSVRAIRQF
jgi:hypothetical protein